MSAVFSACWGSTLHRLLVLSCLCVAVAVRPFFESNYFSARRAHRVNGDVGSLDVLAQVVDRCSVHGELILFAFDANWMDWAVNMGSLLHHVGFNHFVALGAGPSACTAFNARLPGATCVWNTKPSGEHWDARRDSTLTLWIRRYQTALSLSARVNVLLMDLDTIVFNDPYPLLHSEPMASIPLIYKKEGFANGGLFYLRRNTVVTSPVRWVFDSVLEKAELIARAEFYDHKNLGTIMDQALLNDALNAAGCNSSKLDMPSTYVTGPQAWDHPFWQTRSPVFGKTAAELSRRVEGGSWYCPMKSTHPTTYSHAPAQGGNKFSEVFYKNRPLEFLDLRIPLDVPYRSDLVERFAVAPQWLFGTCEDAFSGYEFSAIIHLVACSPDYGRNPQWTHVGRRALMVAAGSWLPGSSDAPLATLTTAHELARGVSSFEQASRLIRAVIFTAVKAGRVPVLPGFECHHPWIEKQFGTVYDKRIVHFKGLCYPAPASNACTHDLVLGGYEFKALHYTNPKSGVDNKLVSTLSDYTAGDPAMASLEARCPGYFV